jgi:protein kinase C substrate 80K-H
VPFVYVNDGVCDYDLCCDGSEEFAHKGGVKCENRCAEIGKQHRRKAEEQRKNMEKASKKRQAMVTEATELRKRAEASLATLQEEVARLEKKKAELELKYEEVQRTETGKTVQSGDDARGGKLGVLVGVAKARVRELRHTLDDVVAQRNDLRGRVDELETILRKFKEEYNPNFNDEGVKAAVKSFEDYSTRDDVGAKDCIPDSEIEEILKQDSETSGVNWQEFEDDEGSDTDICKSKGFEEPRRWFICIAKPHMSY